MSNEQRQALDPYKAPRPKLPNKQVPEKATETGLVGVIAVKDCKSEIYQNHSALS